MIKRTKLNSDNRVGDPSCDQKPGLPIKRICHGLVTSEYTSDGQLKGYSHGNRQMVIYNHRVEPVRQPTQNPCSEKKAKQRKTQHKKQLFKSRMKGHVIYLEKMGWFKDDNKEEIIDNPSYSVIHSLS